MERLCLPNVGDVRWPCHAESARALTHVASFDMRPLTCGYRVSLVVAGLCGAVCAAMSLLYLMCSTVKMCSLFSALDEH